MDSLCHKFGRSCGLHARHHHGKRFACLHQLAAWNSYAASNSDFTDSVCHRLNGTVLRPNAKDINVDGKQAVILWWLEPGAVVVHFKAGHRAVATSAAKFVAAALDAQFVPVSGHFSEIERMIFDIGDHAAIIQFRGNDAGSRLAILEHTVAHRGEFLYLHYIDSVSYTHLTLPTKA